MLRINLLPPREKKEVAWANLCRLVASLSIWLFIFSIIFTLFLLSIYFYLSTLLETQNRLMEIRQKDPSIQRLVEIEKRIKQANKRVNQIYLKQKNLILWVPVFEELAEITPPGAYLNNFSYQQKDNQIDLSGWADTRDSLLLLQNLLEKSPLFVEVKAPLSNLLRQTDIDFSFSFKPVIPQ